MRFTIRYQIGLWMVTTGLSLMGLDPKVADSLKAGANMTGIVGLFKNPNVK